MKESIGGSWLLGFVIIFVVLFSGYLAISINYTKAFKVKNKILNIIEQNEGFSKSSENDIESKSITELSESEFSELQIIAALKSMGYYIKDTNEKEKLSKCDKDSQGTYQTGGYCLKHICTSRGNYYKVTTFIGIDIPLINLSVDVPIKGDTPIIYYDVMSCEEDI